MKSSPRYGRLLGWLALATLVAGPVFALRSKWAWDEACAVARERLPEVLHMDVAIERCELDPLRQGVRIYGVRASLPGHKEPLVTAESAEVRLGAFQLFGAVELALVHLVQPRIDLDLSSFKLPPKPDRVCPLEAFDHLALNRLMIRDADVRLRLSGGRVVTLSSVDLGWAMRRGVAEIELRVTSGEIQQGGGRPTLAVGQVSVQATLDPEAEQLQIASAEAAIDDITLSLSGKVDTLCDPNLALDAQAFLPLRTLSKVMTLPEHTQGHVMARALMSGPAEGALSVTAEVTGAGLQFGKFEPGNFTAKVSSDGKELRLLELSAPAGAGTVKASGTVGLSGSYPVKAQVQVDRAQLGKVLDKVTLRGSWVDTLVTGKGALSGTGRPLQLAGDVSFDVADFHVEARPYDQPRESILEFADGHLEGGIKVLADRVELTGMQLSSGKSHAQVDAQLHYDQGVGLNIEGRINPLDLSDFGHIAKFEWGGTGSASVLIRGPYRDQHIESQVSLRDFQFWDLNPGVVQGKAVFERGVLRFPGISGQKGKTQYFGSAELDWSKPVRALRAEAHVPKGRAEDLVDAMIRLHSSVELFQSDLTGDAKASMQFQGPMDAYNGTIDVELGNLRYYGRELGAGQLGLVFTDGEVMALKGGRIHGPAGTLTGDGTFNFSGPLSYRFRGDDLQLGELLGRERAKQLGASGTIQVQGKVAGDREVPVVTGYATAPRITFAEKSLGAMGLNFQIEGRQMQVWGRPFGDARSSLKMTLRAPIPYELSLSLTLPEIRPLLPDSAISQGLSGSLSGTLTAKGEIKTTGSSVATAVIDRLSLSRGDFAGQTAGPVTLAYERGKYSLETATFQGPNTQLTAGGWAGPDAIDARLQGTVDVRLLSSFLPGVERAGGEVEISAAASGSLASPSLLGSARVRDARMSLRDQAVAVRALSGRVEFSEKQIRLEEMDGVLNDGRLSLHGYAELDKLRPKRGGCTRREDGADRPISCMQLQAQLDEVSVRLRDDMPFNVSGELELYDQPGDTMVLAGGVSISKLRYDRPLDLETVLKDFARTKDKLAQSAEVNKPKEWLKFNVGVDLQDVRIDNNLARARLVGKATVTGTNARPGLLGMIEAAEGSQVFFRQNRFDISEMLLEFKERYSIDAVFDMHGQSQVREYAVRLHAFGRPNEPKVVFTAEPQLSEPDVLSLLTLGITSKDRGKTGGDAAAVAGAGFAAEAFLNATGLDREVQRLLPKNQVFKDLSVHVSTSYNDATRQMEPAAQIESRLLTENLRLELTQPFSGKGTRARAEWRLSDGLLLQGQWDGESDRSSASGASSVGNLGVDLKLRWEVK